MVVLVYYSITEQDKQILLQPQLNFQYRFTIRNDSGNILDTVNDIIPESHTISSEDNIRRKISISYYNIKDVEKWLNLYMRLNFVFEIGVFSYFKGDYVWYPCGTYIMTDSSTVYDSMNNVLSTTLEDWFAKMDGTCNGQIGGATSIVIEQKDSNGNITTIQKALRNFIVSEGITDKIIIEDIGEFYGIQSTNPTGYDKYRKNNPDWNKMPYDLEFSAGDTQADVVSEITELYPNVQAYFDVYNNFCCNMIPSCQNDSIILDNDFIQRILISDSSENTTYSLSEIKNVTEVFGKSYDIDRNADENCSIYSNIFNLNIEKYDEYAEYEIITFKPKATNIENPMININSYGNIPIYQEYTSTPIPIGTIKANEVNTIMIRKQNERFISYYLGQFQPHGLCVLTGDLNDKKYTKKYFEEKYNCKNVVLRLESESPYTIQKIGEILDVKSGDEFDNIKSNSVAEQNAIYFNRKSSSMNDTVEISTILIPWLDVNQKVEYKKANSTETNQYIIKNISHDLSSDISTITLQRFYPLYYD